MNSDKELYLLAKECAPFFAEMAGVPLPEGGDIRAESLTMNRLERRIDLVVYWMDKDSPSPAKSRAKGRIKKPDKKALIMEFESTRKPDVYTRIVEESAWVQRSNGFCEVVPIIFFLFEGLDTQLKP